MSSSNRQPVSCDAAVYRQQHVVGPIRLPEKNPLTFIEQFNRIYRSAGIELQRTDVVENETPPNDDNVSR